LPWYLINPNNTYYKIQFILLQIMSWISVFLTPLIRVYIMMGSKIEKDVLVLVWIIDIFWCL